MASNLLVTIPVITVRAFRHCLFCSPIVSDRPNSSLSTKTGPLSINPFRLSPTFPRLSLFLSVWIMRSYLAWTGPCRLFLQIPFRFVSPSATLPRQISRPGLQGFDWCTTGGRNPHTKTNGKSLSFSTLPHIHTDIHTVSTGQDDT